MSPTIHLHLVKHRRLAFENPSEAEVGMKSFHHRKAELTSTETSLSELYQTDSSKNSFTYEDDENEDIVNKLLQRKVDCNLTDKKVCIAQFNFIANALSLRRNVQRNVDLEEMINVKYLCAGSNSHIFSAIWEGQNVIVKTLQRAKATCSIAISELNIECELLMRIDHPNVIRILAAGIFPKPFIVLERLQDVSQLFNFKSHKLFRRRPFSFGRTLELAKNLADALRYLHSEINDDGMIIHRDLKPENLGLNSNGEMILFDFGLCRCVQKRTQDNQVYQMTGNTGSLRYMAPEVVLGHPYNEKVDVYSFAVVLWALATGCEPFSDLDVASHRSKVVLSGMRPKMKRSWPTEFQNLLTDCWQNRSTLRPNFVVISERISKITVQYANSAHKLSTMKCLLRSISMPTLISKPSTP